MKSNLIRKSAAESLALTVAITCITCSSFAAGGTAAGGGAAGTGSPGMGPSGGQPEGTAPNGMPPYGTAPNGQPPYGTAPNGVPPYGTGPYSVPTNTATPSNATPIVPGSTPPFNNNNNVAPTNGAMPNNSFFRPSGNGYYRRGDEDGFLRGTNGFYRPGGPNGPEFVPDAGEFYERGPDGLYYPSDSDDTRGIYRNGVLYNGPGTPQYNLTNGIR